jgi:hypothetical protein
MTTPPMKSMVLMAPSTIRVTTTMMIGTMTTMSTMSTTLTTMTTMMTMTTTSTSMTPQYEDATAAASAVAVQ